MKPTENVNGYIETADKGGNKNREWRSRESVYGIDCF
jgi:hypothetical protein